MIDIFEFIFDKVGDLLSMLDNFMIFPNVSLLSFFLGILLITIIFNLLMFFNFGGLITLSKDFDYQKRKKENFKDKQKQKKGYIFIFLLISIFSFNFNVKAQDIIVPFYNNFKSNDLFHTNYLKYQELIDKVYYGDLLYNNNPITFHFVIGGTTTSTLRFCQSVNLNASSPSLNDAIFTASCSHYINFSLEDFNSLYLASASGNYNVYPTISDGTNRYFTFSNLLWSDGSSITNNSSYDFLIDISSSAYLDFSSLFPYGSNNNITSSQFLLYRKLGLYITPEDITPPTLTLNGISPYNHEINTIYNDSGYTCTDEISTCSVVITGAVDITTLGEYTLTFTATDEKNNSTFKKRVINVVDTISPNLILKGSQKNYLIVNNEYIEEGFIVNDNSLEEITPTITDDININKVGEYLIIYEACDSSENCTTATRQIFVVEEFPLEFTGSQYLFVDFEDIKSIFPNLYLDNLSHYEKISLTILINIFILGFIAFILSILYKAIVRIFNFY